MLPHSPPHPHPQTPRHQHCMRRRQSQIHDQVQTAFGERTVFVPSCLRGKATSKNLVATPKAAPSKVGAAAEVHAESVEDNVDDSSEDSAVEGIFERHIAKKAAEEKSTKLFWKHAEKDADGYWRTPLSCVVTSELVGKLLDDAALQDVSAELLHELYERAKEIHGQVRKGRPLSLPSAPEAQAAKRPARGVEHQYKAVADKVETLGFDIAEGALEELVEWHRATKKRRNQATSSSGATWTAGDWLGSSSWTSR